MLTGFIPELSIMGQILSRSAYVASISRYPMSWIAFSVSAGAFGSTPRTVYNCTPIVRNRAAPSRSRGYAAATAAPCRNERRENIPSLYSSAVEAACTILPHPIELQWWAFGGWVHVFHPETGSFRRLVAVRRHAQRRRRAHPDRFQRA